MYELQTLLKKYRTYLTAQKVMALVTVLRVEGSSYRQAGARMLISEEGEIVGSVSGGCLERDLIRKALAGFQMIILPSFQVFRYDTTEDGDEHESLPSVSLGCQGIVDMGLEILPAGRPHEVLERLMTALGEEKPLTLGTIISAPSRFPVAAGFSFFHAPANFDPELKSKIAIDLADLKVTTDKNYVLQDLGDTPVTILFEKVTPALRWIIFGASHDAVPLATLGRFMGWHVTVVDCHSAYTMPDRFFTQVDSFIKCTPAEVSSKLKLEGAYCAVVTHNYFHDLEILKQLLQVNVEYIGFLGPKTKSVTALEDIKKENPSLEMKSLERLFSPAGLDAGGLDPHSIALAIVAEALTVSSKREGGFLRDRTGPIHDRK